MFSAIETYVCNFFANVIIGGLYLLYPLVSYLSSIVVTRTERPAHRYRNRNQGKIVYFFFTDNRASDVVAFFVSMGIAVFVILLKELVCIYICILSYRVFFFCGGINWYLLFSNFFCKLGGIVAIISFLSVLNLNFEKFLFRYNFFIFRFSIFHF